MSDRVESFIQESTAASACKWVDTLQELWSGYGEITRYALTGGSVDSVIVKRISPPKNSDHPRGWNTDVSHQRKIRSYKVESYWYSNYAQYSDASFYLPTCYAVNHWKGETILVLEDLDASGFSGRRRSISKAGLSSCLTWLANFHARFLGDQGRGLWPIGTYWHLDTRPDELRALEMEDSDLWNCAEAIDKVLNEAQFQTLVHGDAKLANFCFGDSGDSVAAVDFQYVGRGCGMKDVAYFIGSCLDETACTEHCQALLEVYFKALRAAVVRYEKDVDFSLLEAEWRRLFAFAWTDFHRFLKGWSPGHWKINSYSERMARSVITSIMNG